MAAGIPDGLIFPITGYTFSVKDVPNFNKNDIRDYYKSRTETEDHFKRSYNFFVEEYVERASIQTRTDGHVIFIKAKCHRSQKKGLHPYTVAIAMHLIEGILLDSYCECPYGATGICNHVMALLRLLLHIKTTECSVKESIAKSCTELPQKWNRKRGDKIHPLCLLDINFQSPKENGSLKDMPCKLYECRRHIRTEEELNEAVKKLSLTFAFARTIHQPNGNLWSHTKLGASYRGSPLTYQLANTQSELELLHNLAVYTPEFIDLRHKYIESREIPHFAVSNTCSYGTSGCFFPLNERESTFLENIKLCVAECIVTEKRTVMQSEEVYWKEMRKSRLCSSQFGQVCRPKRKAMTAKAINGIINPSDIGHLNAVKYGKKMESVARKNYVAQMHDIGHKVEVVQSGLIINPKKPWLGTSPDGIVYDPKADVTFGLLEIKCAYSSRDCLPSEAVESSTSYIKMVDGEPKLNESHQYFYQVIGQMGLSGFQWCDFVVYFEKGLIIQRINFVPEK